MERQTGACDGGSCDCPALQLRLSLSVELSLGAGSSPLPGQCTIFEATGLFLELGPWKQVWSRLEGHVWNLFKSSARLFWS